MDFDEFNPYDFDAELKHKLWKHLQRRRKY